MLKALILKALRLVSLTCMVNDPEYVSSLVVRSYMPIIIMVGCIAYEN